MPRHCRRRLRAPPLQPATSLSPSVTRPPPPARHVTVAVGYATPPPARHVTVAVGYPTPPSSPPRHCRRRLRDPPLQPATSLSPSVTRPPPPGRHVTVAVGYATPPLQPATSLSPSVTRPPLLPPAPPALV